MRGIIKGVLAEELDNSLHMKTEYEKKMKLLPKGCLTVKKIKGHEYCYLVERKNKKVFYKYLGKLSASEKTKHKENSLLRIKYRRLLSQLKKQIKFLRGSLRGKQAV